jgi:hypothetical protein
MESNVKSEKIREGKAMAAQRGLSLAPQTPFGYQRNIIRDTGPRRIVGGLIPNDDAQHVRTMFGLAAAGKSVAQVRDLMAALGVRLPRSRVHRILTNVAYIGAITHNGDIAAENAHEPLIDRETFERVQASLRANRKVQARTRNSGYLLTSLAFCGQCGGRMYGKQGRPGSQHSYNASVEYHNHVGGSVGGQAVDAIIKEWVTSNFGASFDLATAAERMARYSKSRADEAQAQRKQLERSLVQHEENRKRIARAQLGLDGAAAISPEMYASLDADDAEAIRVIDQTIANLDATPATDDTASPALLIEALDTLNLNREGDLVFTVSKCDSGGVLALAEALLTGASTGAGLAVWQTVCRAAIASVVVSRGDKRRHHRTDRGRTGTNDRCADARANYGVKLRHSETLTFEVFAYLVRRWCTYAA